MALILVHATAGYCLEASVNYAVFHKHGPNGSDSTFLEVYWQINPVSLHYHKNANGELSTQIQTAISISTDTGKVLRERFVLQTKPALPGEAAQQNLLQFKRYAVPAGNLQLHIDLGESEFIRQAFSYNQTINTLDDATGPHFSNLQLLDTFVAGTAPNIFYKNGVTQLPRVLPFYDNGQRLLHFYEELYIPQQAAGPLVRHFYIARKRGDLPILRLQLFDTLRQPLAINTGLHTLYIGSLATGNYYLNAALTDEQGNMIDTQSMLFQMINAKPDIVVRTANDSLIEAKRTTNFLDLGKTFVGKYNAKQVLAILKMIRPVAEPAEVKTIDNFFRQPDDMYIRYFIYNYFSKENKARPEDAWKAFSNQIREINKDFNGGSKLGYETDRGRIYLQYGKPDERIRVPNEQGALPYEIWRYDAIEKRQNQIGTFLFYQPGYSASDFILLTSTVTGEPNNPSWRSMLFLNGQSSSNSRADQYMEGK